MSHRSIYTLGTIAQSPWFSLVGKFMSTNTTKVSSLAEKKTDKADLAAMIAEDKKQRTEKCVEVVNQALKDHGCTVNLFVHIGDQKFPINAIITAPIEISIDAIVV